MTRRRHALSTTPLAAGFTLVEIAVVMVLVGLLTIAIAKSQAVSFNGLRVTQTTNNQTAVMRALAAYLLANGVLPCPANSGVITTDAQYGTAVSTCSPAANLGTNSVNFQGTIPFRTLGIAESFTYDAFGNRMEYDVAPEATTAGSLTAFCHNANYTEGTNALTVNDINGNPLTTAPPAGNPVVAILVSHGRTGVGSFTPPPPISSGDQAPSRIGTGGMAVSSGKTENLNDDFTFTYATISDATPGVNFFDDIVMYSTNVQLYTLLGYTGLAVCPD